MPLKTPSFWYRDPQASPPLRERLLAPFCLLYDWGRKLNLPARPPVRVNVPVVCIGSILAGGSGKTPVALALYELITQNALAATPFFLTRGYGGSEKGPLLVRAEDEAKRTGDEPLLLQRKGPVVVAQDRPAGAFFAQERGADLILMDDGFQNPSLRKNLAFLVVDGAAGLGNARLLPCGPLREPLAEALPRADAVIVIGADKHGIAARIPPAIPVFRADIAAHFTGDKTTPRIAFAGLGRPEKFKTTLQNEGFTLRGFHAFADHHPYTEKDMEILLRAAEKENAALITTEKDFVRIPPAYRKTVTPLPITLAWDDEQAMVSFLKEKLTP